MELHKSNLIPPPRVVRSELARTYEQARLLRRLLRLSEDAAPEYRRQSSDRYSSARDRRSCPERPLTEAAGSEVDRE